MNNGIATTPHEQSQRLLACGVPADTADMAYATNDDILLTAPYAEMRDRFKETNCIPAWSLSALLTKVLPSNIRYEGHTCLLELTSSNWQSDEQIWEASYDIDLGVEASDPIEACVLMVEWLHNEKYI